MDRAVSGAVPHLRNGTAGQVGKLAGCIQAGCNPRWCRRGEMSTDEPMQRPNLRKIIVVSILLLVVLGFYVTSFLVMGN